MVFFQIFRFAYLIVQFLNIFFNFKFFICDIRKIDRNSYKFVIPVNDFYFKNNFDETFVVENTLTFQYLYGTYFYYFFNGTKNFENSFVFSNYYFDSEDNIFYDYAFLNFFIYTNFANCSFVTRSENLYYFIKNNFFNFFFVMFNIFSKFKQNDFKLLDKIIFINFKSYWSLFAALKYKNLIGRKRCDELSTGGYMLYKPNFLKLIDAYSSK
jgi:hypothetical protein